MQIISTKEIQVRKEITDIISVLYFLVYQSLRKNISALMIYFLPTM